MDNDEKGIWHSRFIEGEINATRGKAQLIRIYSRTAFPKQEQEIISLTRKLEKVCEEMREELERLNLVFNYDKPIYPVRDNRA